MEIQTTLDYIAKGSQICTAVGVYHTLRAGRRSGRKRYGQHIILMRSLGMETGPALAPVAPVVRQPFQDGLIKGAA